MPWVWLIGRQKTITSILSSTNLITLHHSFNTGTYKAGIKNLEISGNTNIYFDLQTIGGSGIITIEIESLTILNQFTFKGRSVEDFLEFLNSDIYGFVSIYALSLQIRNCLLRDNLLISDVGSNSTSGGTVGI